MSVRLLIAVKSCQRDMADGYHDLIRSTWGADIKHADLRFFVGGEITDLLRQDDEVRVKVYDDYYSLPYKTQAILDWAVISGYDYVFLCDTDTYVDVDKMMTSGFQQYDYYGVNSKQLGRTFGYNATDREGRDHFIEQCWPWMSGGIGFFVSKKAAEFIVNAVPETWAEDLFCGQVLGPLNVQGEIMIANMTNRCSWHWPKAIYKGGLKKWMHEMRQRVNR